MSMDKAVIDKIIESMNKRINSIIFVYYVAYSVMFVTLQIIGICFVTLRYSVGNVRDI